MRSNGENIAKETSNKLSENRKSFGHLCKKSPQLNGEKNPSCARRKNRCGAGFFYGPCKVSANLDRVIDICPRIVYDKP